MSPRSSAAELLSLRARAQCSQVDVDNRGQDTLRHMALSLAHQLEIRISLPLA